MTINVGLVGLGNITQYHDIYKKAYITHLKSLEKIPFFKIKFGCDLKKKNCLDFSRKTNAFVSQNINLCLKKYHPELIVIAVPTKMQMNCIKKIIDHYSPKVILCEKPFCENLIQIKKMKNILRRKNIKIFINYPRIYNPFFHKMKKILLKNNSSLLINVSYKSTLLENGSHFISLFNFLLGKKVMINKKKK